ncbi:MAG: twin-arginine translocation signal domain-containing protein, partial [Gammaproteobacteria bacterium]|nr:twin-arginine translocation signal domain-containing protein [Gammaproteobacteria bacterium]
MKHERGLFELYDDDPERAERIVCGSRRNFLKRSTAAAAILGAPMIFARNLAPGLMPVALAETAGLTLTTIPGKDPMIVLNDRPLNAEPLAHQLDDAVTPAKRMFVRNNGIVPLPTDPGAWRLTVTGEAATRDFTFSIED